MSTILFSLPELYKNYKSWVAKNPQSLGDFETTVKWLSYFIAGRINNSHVLSELVYCLSNLLVLFNDRLITNVRRTNFASSAEKLKLWLTIIEYSEVFLELSARKFWGNSGRWLIILSVQLFKCFARMVLIFHHREPIIQDPAIPVLNRKQILQGSDSPEINEARLDAVSFTLKSTGRVVRKVDCSPPNSLRNWKPVREEILKKYGNEKATDSTLAGKLLLAESIYIVKPIVHLGSVACFGNNTWKPWMVALAADLVSLYLYGTSKNSKVSTLSYRQRLQISRRTLALILYILRSPFYERHSKTRIDAFLNAVGQSIPLAGLVCTPLAQYLPFWQEQYFYMWST